MTETQEQSLAGDLEQLKFDFYDAFGVGMIVDHGRLHLA